MKKKLNLHQQLYLEQYKRDAARLSKDQAIDLLIQAIHLRMVKDNIVEYFRGKQNEEHK